jgi:hypothetical protein
MSSLSREERYAVERQLAKNFNDEEDEGPLDSTVIFNLQHGNSNSESDSHLVFGEASFGSPNTSSSLTPSSSFVSLNTSIATTQGQSQTQTQSPKRRSPDKQQIETIRERRLAPRLALQPLESTPIPLQIEEWHYALASIANEKQADEAAALGATSVSAALAQRKAEVLLVKAASERNAEASMRVAHEQNIAALLFDSIPQHIAAATAATTNTTTSSNTGKVKPLAQSNSRNGDTSTFSSQQQQQQPIKKSSLSATVARAVFLPLCPTAAPEYDPISVKADLAFVKHMTRLGRDDPDAVQRLLRRHLFLCCRLFKGDPWLPSVMNTQGDDSPSTITGQLKRLPLSKLSPVDAALEISRVVGSHSVGSKSAAFRALFRKMYSDAMLTLPLDASTLPPIVPRSTLEAAVADLNSYSLLLARGLLLKYSFLSSLPMVSNPIRFESKTPVASAQTPRLLQTPAIHNISQSPQQQLPTSKQQHVEVQQQQPLVRKTSSFLSLLASTAPSLFGPLPNLPNLPPSGGSAGEGGFTMSSSISSPTRRRPSQQQMSLLKPVDLGPSLLRCTQEALHILCNDTLFGVVLAHTRLQDEDAAPFLLKMSTQPPCAFGLSHAFCGQNEASCTRSREKGTELDTIPVSKNAAEKAEECYSAAIECLHFLQQQRSPLTKLGALRNCLKAITFSAAIEERLGGSQSLDMAQSSSSVGADDLMPRICFVIARACRRTSALISQSSNSTDFNVALRMRPFAELCYLEECMPQDKLLGEDGYTLVSVRGALMHVVMLGKSLNL